MLLIGVFLRHRHVFGLCFCFIVLFCFFQLLTTFVVPVCPCVAVSSEVELAQVQISSCLCVCSICLAPLGAFKMFHVNWNVISFPARPLVCPSDSSVVSVSWLAALTGLRGPAHYHDHHHVTTVVPNCQSRNTLFLWAFCFSLFVYTDFLLFLKPKEVVMQTGYNDKLFFLVMINLKLIKCLHEGI